MTKVKPCKEEGCDRPKDLPAHRCLWHNLLTLSIDDQVRAARRREMAARGRAGFAERARVPEAEWPAGERWCSGCQGFVPLFYTSGARCRACASRATHKSHVERTYGISYDDYERLLEYQKGRCYVCHQKPRGRRLAIDHDHETNKVRGLLCANDQFGCNVQLRRLLGDPASCERLLAYATQSPLERMRAGEPAPKRVDPKAKAPYPSIADLIRSSKLGSNTLEPPPEPAPAPQERVLAASGARSWQSDPAWDF